MEPKRIKLTTFVPLESANSVREALGRAGAGKIGEYSYCSYSVTGTGRFLPSHAADPHIGTPGLLEAVAEERIEVVCDLQDARAIIAALKQAHPSEEVAFDLVPLIDELAL